MFPALHTCIPNVPCAYIYVYNLNKETQQTNTQTCGKGEKEGARLLFFLILNPRYLVFVLEKVSMQEGDLQEKSQVESMQGKSLVLPYYLLLSTYLLFRYIKKLQVGTLLT